MGETVGILFVFFILLVFGFVFYMNVMRSSSEVDLEENLQLKAIGIAQKASFLPELQCSEENVRTEDCIDLYKLKALSDMVDGNRLYYYDIFEYSDIYVKEIFPDLWEDEGDWKYLYQNSLTEYKDKISTFIPVSLYDPNDKSYSFGILAVEVYRK